MGKITDNIYIKRIASVLFIAGMFMLMSVVFEYVTVDDTKSFTRVMMHEYYNQKEIDTVFAGASLCYRSFDTKILDDAFDENTFNLGSSSQPIDTSYYLLKDALDRYNIKRVFLDISVIMAMRSENENRTFLDLIGTHIITDYMHPSKNKYEHIINASRSEYYIDGIFPAKRKWKDFSLRKALKVLKNKNNSAYKEYKYDILNDKYEHYEGKGFVGSTIKVKDFSFYDAYANEDIRVEKIGRDWHEYLDKIINLCVEKNAELTLIHAPMSDYLLAVYDDKYDFYHKHVAKIAEDKLLRFLDFNLCRQEYFSIDANLYKDSAHLNEFGAEKFSRLFAKVVNKELRFEDIIYSSVKEKLDDLPPKVCGIVSTATGKRVIANKPEAFEYKAVLADKQGKNIILKEWSSSTEIPVKKGVHGTLKLLFREVAQRDKETTVEFKI